MDAEHTHRTYDFVVWGATGYTGELVARELARTAEGLRWAIAGRNRGRLDRCREGLDGSCPPDVLVATLDDPDSLRAMTADCRVVLTTVGPYARYGEPLVDACIATATHLCDITGEVDWVRSMRRKYDAAARDAGVRIVSMCGYDSVPSELGVHLVQARVMERDGRPAGRVSMAVGPIRGGVSGGTIASAAHHVSTRNPDPDRPRSAALALCERDDADAGRIQFGLRYDRILRAWTAPFVMASVNVAVVHRSHELLGRPWGRSFRYGESALGGSGIGGLFRAILTTLATWVFAVAFFLPPTRHLLRRWWLPAPGEGPSEARRAEGFFHHRVAASDTSIELSMSAQMDPGYEATAVMLVACGRGILEDDVIDGATTGFCTPVAVLGAGLADRLQARGFTFAWSDVDPQIT